MTQRLDLTAFDALLIDLDGTLVDTLGDFEVALNRMLADLPAPFCHAVLQRADIETMVGKGSEHLIKTVLAHVESAQPATDSIANENPPAMASALYERAWTRYQHHYQAINGDFSIPYPGALATLQGLRMQGKKLACLTNKPTAFARALLQSKGMADCFELICGGDAFARRKPDPLPLLKACQALGTEPRRSLMIGDSSNDAQAARAAGCPVWLVRYGYNHGQPIEAVAADGYLDSLQQLV